MTLRGKITLLLFFISVCGSAVLMRHHWEPRPNRARPADLYAVVCNQLSAFRMDDYSRAYQHASSNFQQKFNVEQFADLVRSDYHGMLRAARVEFGPVEHRGDHALIQVFFIDDRGQVFPCVYSLVNEGDSWKIDGARMLQRWPAGTRLGGLQS
jgi:hypothetical protein